MKKRIISLIVLSALAALVLSCGVSGKAQTTAEEWLLKGKDLAVSREYEKAIECYTKVIEIDPDYGFAYLSRGCCYDGLGKFDQAIADFTKAIELMNDSTSKYTLPGAYLFRGLTYMELNDYENAKKDFKTACDLGNSTGCTYSNFYK